MAANCHAYLRSIIQADSTDSGRKPNSVLFREQKAVGIYEKGKGNNDINRRKTVIGAENITQ